MIPYLYSKGTTSYTSSGLGRLGECTRCLVTEERNGKYEVEFDYPITGKYYNVIQKDCIILVTHDEAQDRQPFRIYRKSAPIDGIVTFNAHHISYDLCNIIVQPFTATSISDAFDKFVSKAINTNNFSFWTDSISSGNFEAEVPASVRSLLGGQRGSILDVYGGEYKFDNTTVKNYAHRGNDNGVSILYGKNLTDITDTSDNSSTYNAIVPYWTDNEDTVVFGGIVSQAGATTIKAVALDLSSEYETAPTVAQLEAKAATYLSNNTPWNQSENIKIDFVALWQTEEYKNYAPLERVQLCDTVHVKYAALGVDATAKVIKVVWNALADRYDSMELGEARSSFADTIISKTDTDISAALKPYARTSMMDEAISHATSLITGGLGGYIQFLYDANDHPTDMLVMDHDTLAASTNILRINVNGIGFSNDGGSTYSSAWTLDGAFVADFITAGHLSCNRIQGGTLSLGGVGNGNGTLVVYDALNNEIGRIDNSAIMLKNGITKAFCGKEKNFQYSTLSGMDWTDVEGFSINHEYSDSVFTREVWTRGYNYGYPQHTMATNAYNYFDTKALGLDDYNAQGDPDTYRAIQDWYHYDSTNDITYFEKKILATGHDNPRVSFSENGFIFTNDQVNANDVHIKVSKSSGIDIRSGDYKILIDANNTKINGQTIAFQGNSSERYKHEISDNICMGLAPERLYELKLKQFVFNDAHPLQYRDMAGKTLPGFIAEDVEEIYPAAVIHDKDGNVENWDERRILPGMLALIQKQKKQLDEQEERIKKLEAAIEALQEARHE